VVPVFSQAKISNHETARKLTKQIEGDGKRQHVSEIDFSTEYGENYRRFSKSHREATH
jgi:hypothetical protein